MKTDVILIDNQGNGFENALAENIKKYYPECQAVFGTSTAGIAHAAYVSEILNMQLPRRL